MKKQIVLRISGVADNKIHEVMNSLHEQYPSRSGYVVTNWSKGYFHPTWNVEVLK